MKKNEKLLVTVRFPLRPVIFCPGCCAALEYVHDRGETFVVHKTMSSCQYSGKKYRGPLITLQEVS